MSELSPIAASTIKTQSLPIKAPRANLPTAYVAPAPLLPAAAKIRRRHQYLARSFLLFVIGPVLISAWYLYELAADQFTSSIGFAVRTEEARSGLDIAAGLSGLKALSGSSSSDTDILYEFLQSQALVSKIDTRLDLRAVWSKATNDPVFAFDPTGTIEDLTFYWQRMLQISYDPGKGLISVRVHAFEPNDAQAIATTILEESSAMINELSAVAGENATRYAREELDHSTARLRETRQALTAFRSENRIVDPIADLQGEMGVLNQLQQQLAEELVSLDMLRSTIEGSRGGSNRRGVVSDVRIAQSERRVEVIRSRINEERQKFGGSKERDYSAILGDFERLKIDLEYAEAAWASALAVFENARAEAQHQSRYLATYVAPTLAERPLYPQRMLLLSMIALFLGLGWSVLTLIVYSVRDRR